MSRSDSAPKQERGVPRKGMRRVDDCIAAAKRGGLLSIFDLGFLLLLILIMHAQHYKLDSSRACPTYDNKKKNHKHFSQSRPDGGMVSIEIW